MKLIDAHAVAEAINDEIKIAAEIGTYKANVCKGGLMMALAYVNTAPVVDAVPVVRCKDCKNWTEWENCAGSCQRSGSVMWLGTDATDFCSFAERKDNEID